MSDKGMNVFFSGKKIDWGVFKVRFLALAYKQDFRDVLLKQVTIPDENKANMTDDEKGIIKNMILGLMNYYFL